MSVMAALRDSGLRKAWIPLEMASTPDNATAPDENARSKRKAVTPDRRAPGAQRWRVWVAGGRKTSARGHK